MLCLTTQQTWSHLSHGVEECQTHYHHLKEACLQLIALGQAVVAAVTADVVWIVGPRDSVQGAMHGHSRMGAR